VGTSDGKIHVMTRAKEWHKIGFLAHNEAVNSVSWASFDSTDKQQIKRLVSCSSDRNVKLWEFKEESAPSS
jgi:WD40 repeat protein